MRAFVVALICSGVLLSPAAFADQAQTDSTTVPSASAQQSAAPAATVAPATTPTAGATMPAPAAAAPATTAAADSSAVNLDEIVCRAVAAPTGTRLGGGRECHSVRQWNDLERQSQDLTRQNQTRGFKAKGS